MSGKTRNNNCFLVVFSNVIKLFFLICMLNVVDYLSFTRCEAQQYQLLPLWNPFPYFPGMAPENIPPQPMFFYHYAMKNPVDFRSAQNPVDFEAAQNPVDFKVAQNPVDFEAAQNPGDFRVSQNPLGLRAAAQQYLLQQPILIPLSTPGDFLSFSLNSGSSNLKSQWIRALPRDQSNSSTASTATDPVLRKAYNTCGKRGTPRHIQLVGEDFNETQNIKPSADVSSLMEPEPVEYQGPDLTNTSFYKSMKGPNLVETKITYGKEADNNEAPWQVAMFIGKKFHCGASLVDESYILTAAHCVTSYTNRPEALKIFLGDWELNTLSDGKHFEAKVKKIIAHPDFNFFTLQNDIALLELKEKVVFTDRIRAICLPTPGLSIKEKLITVTGWGRNERNILQNKLRKLTAAVIENDICADRWSRSGAPRSLIGSGTLCMDTQYGDSCKGDSGGPSVMENPEGSGKFFQVGIVSFGSGSCIDPSLPGVYTRIATFRDWIDKNII